VGEGLQGEPGAAEVRARWVPLHGQAALPHAVPGTPIFLGRAGSEGSVTISAALGKPHRAVTESLPSSGGL